MDYERNQLGQVTALYYPDTTSKSGMQIDFSYTSLGKVDTITRSPDTLVDYDYAGSNVLSRSYPDPTNDVHYTLAYDSFGRVTRHHTYQDGTPDVEIADFNYTYDDNGNILSQEFAHRTSTPDNIYTYDDLDRLTEADYLVGVLTEDEQFTYDLLGNRLNLNNRAGSDVVYTHNIANEYATIGGQTVSHDAPGNLSVDVNGYKYFYDYENRLEKVKNSSDALKAEYTYDALGRRIEKYDAAAGTRTRYYYDGWRVLSETNAAGVKQRHYVYGNYLDEALLLIEDDGGAPPTYTDHYYAHDHLFSPVALLAGDGSIEEYYEYDAYGKVTVITDKGTGTWWDGDETTASVSAQGNPYTFTGQRLDSFDNGSLLVMYYKNRYYDTNAGRFLQRDPLGVRDEIGLVNYRRTGAPVFPRRLSFKGQYQDGMNLFEYVRSSPLIGHDPLGLKKSDKVCCKIEEKKFWGLSKSCRQETISNPLGFSPICACKCQYNGSCGKPKKNKHIYVYDAKPGECCWCNVFVVRIPVENPGILGHLVAHTYLIIDCKGDKRGFSADLYPHINIVSNLEVLPWERAYSLWGSCTISCEYAETLKQNLSADRDKWTNRFFGSNCLQFAMGMKKAICETCERY